MGTHPIFESDFDCLTDMNRISSFGTLSRNFAQCSRHKSSASYKSKIAKKTTGSSQLKKLGLDDPNSLKGKGETIGKVFHDSHHEKMKNKSMEMKAKWDAMTDEEKEAIYEKQREQARQERYAKFVLDPQKAKDRSGKATKVFAVMLIWFIGEELDIWKDLGIYSAIINGYRSLAT